MRWVLVAAVVWCAGCDFIRDAALKNVKASLVLDVFNTKSNAVEVVPPGCETLVTSALIDTLADAYFTDDALAPLQPVPLRDAALALLLAPRDDQRVFECLFGESRHCDFGSQVTVHPLTFPSAPALSSGAALGWQTERDVQRVQHNLQRAIRQASSACRTLEGFSLTSDVPAARIVLDRSFDGALSELRHYQTARAFRRVPGRSPVAWVLSGGAANGAFSAGAVWWLLRQHSECGAACADDKVDFVSGASTGTLIATVVKNYFSASATPPERATQLDTLLDKYTCSTNRELYCVQKQSLYRPARHVEPVRARSAECAEPVPRDFKHARVAPAGRL